nr:MAG TPA: hypothetical protein [Caudoviricetes sp.]
MLLYISCYKTYSPFINILNYKNEYIFYIFAQ